MSECVGHDFPAEVITELTTLAGHQIVDFSSMDFVGQPWAWLLALARDRGERSEYLRDSGAPGDMLVDYRETFSSLWSSEVSARLMVILKKMCEEHFALTAQGLHRRAGFYVARMRPLVSAARAVLNPIYAQHIPEEHRRAFISARSVDSSAALPVLARGMALTLMRVTKAPGAGGPKKIL